LDFLQNKSIKEARVMITLADYSKKVKEAFTRLGRSWINWSVPMVYLLKQQDSDKWLFLEKYDFIVFNHSRQIWKEKGDCECKGNDKLIRAFAKFIGLCSSKNPILILFEFGKDVESSKRLIEELNISDRVIWMPLLVRKFIMQGLKKAQIAFDQISTFAAAIGGVTMEAFACAIPIIGKKEFLEMNVVSHVPVLHANEAEDILDILLDCEKYPDKYKQLGKNGQDWFQNNVGIGLALKYKKLMEFMMLNPKLKLEDTDFQNFLLQEFKMKISNC